jgi:hypothetical protein
LKIGLHHFFHQFPLYVVISYSWFMHGVHYDNLSWLKSFFLIFFLYWFFFLFDPQILGWLGIKFRNFFSICFLLGYPILMMLCKFDQFTRVNSGYFFILFLFLFLFYSSSLVFWELGFMIFFDLLSMRLSWSYKPGHRFCSLIRIDPS